MIVEIPSDVFAMFKEHKMDSPVFLQLVSEMTETDAGPEWDILIGLAADWCQENGFSKEDVDRLAKDSKDLKKTGLSMWSTDLYAIAYRLSKRESGVFYDGPM